MDTALAATAFIAAGSNCADRLDHLTRAAQMLADTKDVLSVESAPIYETMPVGPTGPGNFYNTVFRLSVRLSPLELWRRTQAIESALGRPDVNDPGRAGARNLDLDLLFYDDRCFQNEHLTIPHPRLHRRAFVLVPLCDLAPDWHHPELGHTVRELLDMLPNRLEMLGRIDADIRPLPLATRA
ncbi:MAG: 2-amino-4-hydroxy-6-hydroxymethyldihydropteridine diphosphokinase [candidate division Zixibacteria bacterium]|nr:2-amino-4-hydroxy-6-hydroxymethyldihydropteridine diphosphokinase [candidate division Zixibacteria bacterium]